MIKRLLMSITATLIASSVSAKSLSDEDLKIDFEKRFPIKVDAIENSPIPSVKQVITKKGVFYISDDAKHFFQGSLFEMGNGLTNLTEQRYKPVKKNALLEAKQYMHTFKAENEKREIYVFTDVTCGFCGKLHRELDDYLAQGITVNYIAYPRGGLSGDIFNKNKVAWCSDNLRETMDTLFDRKPLQPSSNSACDSNIDKMYELGSLFGINGTPAIVADDMTLFSGYVPANKLAQRLNLN